MADDVDSLVQMGAQLQRGVRKVCFGRKEHGAGTLDAAKIFNENINQEGFVPLFRSVNLNRCVFKKAVTRSTDSPQISPNRVATKVCLPYSQMGGSGRYLYLYYGEKNFDLKIERAFNDSMEVYDKVIDLKILSLLDSVPTFDPFIIKDRFENENYEIDKRYLGITNAEFIEIKTNIMDDFEKIVIISMESDKKLKKQLYSNAASKLFKSLWDLDDMETLRPLARALNVRDENMREYFYSWKGVLFYVYKYKNAFRFLEEDLIRVKELALWDGFGDPQKLAIQLQAIRREKATLRKFLISYHSAFESAFITRSQTEPFLRILNNARSIFWSIGTLIGRLDLYTSYFGQTLGKLPNGRLSMDTREFLNEMQKIGNVGFKGSRTTT